MRTKLVIWGTDANEKRVLLALELLPEKNEVALYVFPEEVASDEFVKSMMEVWRVDQPVSFPENHQRISRPLAMSESILPDEYKVERGDVIQRAQSEWAFVVLSFKLQLAFKSELDAIHQRIESLKEFSQPMWEELKGFWDKVQMQVKERNLFREHVDHLREKSDALFDQMKKLRQNADAEFRKISAENARLFSEKLEDLYQRIEEGKHLINTFDGLKKLQREYHDLQFTRDDRNKLWDRMDAAFKKIKEKRFGDKPAGAAAHDGMSRIEARMKGLVDAIGKMAKSIDRDEKDLVYEADRANSSGEQLEVQLRQAKIAMIEDRVRSKKEKLEDMEKTKKDLEKRMESIARKIKADEEQLQIEQAKKQIKERIAKEIEETGQDLKDKEEELTAAARELAALKSAKKEGKKAPSKAKVDPAAADEAADDAATVGSAPADQPEPDSSNPETAPETDKAVAATEATIPQEVTEEVEPVLEQESPKMEEEAQEESVASGENSPPAEDEEPS